MSIEVIGPYKGPTGYDRHTRAFVTQFVRMGREVQLTHLPNWSVDLPPHMRDTWFDSLTRPIPTGVALHFTMPNHCQPRPGKPNVNYTMFEADRIPRQWVACAAGVERVVVPTESCRRAWIDSGVPESKLRIAPLAVDGEYFRQSAAPLEFTCADGRSILSIGRRFLNVAELRPRKNHAGLIRAWLRATSRADDAILVLKCTSFQPGALDLLRADVEDVQQDVGRSLADAAPTVILTQTLSEEQMRSLYRTATHYISVSHGEGWDLPMMEAGASGLSLIAPAHSAYLSYLTAEDAALIPSRPIPAVITGRVGAEDRVFFNGLQWWEPDEDATVEAIRAAIHGLPRSQEATQTRIVREYTWANAARKLLDALDEITRVGASEPRA